MKLFHWSSDALKQYRSGDILVIAADVAQARDRARAQFDAVCREHWEWMYLDPEDREDIDARLAQFEADIMREPDVAETVFLMGGE